jgi:hypothetical protein
VKLKTDVLTIDYRLEEKLCSSVCNKVHDNFNPGFVFQQHSRSNSQKKKLNDLKFSNLLMVLISQRIEVLILHNPICSLEISKHNMKLAS